MYINPRRAFLREYSVLYTFDISSSASRFCGNIVPIRARRCIRDGGHGAEQDQEHTMAGTKTVRISAEQEFCEAARQGRLRDYLEADPDTANAVLYGIVSEVVYERLTRGLERGRGHHGCAVSVWRLEPDCHDQYQDAVAAVRADLVRHADLCIENVRGWLVPRLKPVVIDDHRRRR